MNANTLDAVACDGGGWEGVGSWGVADVRPQLAIAATRTTTTVARRNVEVTCASCGLETRRRHNRLDRASAVAQEAVQL